MSIFRKKRFWFITAFFFVVAFVLIQFFCSDNCFTLESLRYHSARIKDFIADHYWWSMVLFLALYVFENIFALPIAALLNIGAGYFYGVVPGILLTLVSATCGAWVSFFLARFLLGNFLQATYKERLMRFNREFKRHGPYYLLMVRFMPFIPFVMVNMFAGLTLVSFTTFTWTTFFGMIPLVVMYALAGNQFQVINSPRDIFSWQMITILGILITLTIEPIVLRRLRLVNGNNHT